ncbi:MAG: HPr(Ser) kinase/phosphatase [Verrucomicrobiales bacterium]|jgi:HPr kinase/phosphorylase|nr:HPr(Ser) kinase/phosphatase [Verrucomicrobiales bacterium]MBP9222575.1 HPr(Ser) kinase/phosphatase [Verrucomicrobiales bacterium]HQZ26977.1 HPr(Ser) kinase/phosphatase [Verrucomicrobiales bacterium]
MARNSTISKPTSIRVGDYYEKHHDGLAMELVGTSEGYDRKILEPTINRPGLALSGFYKYFALHRIQVIGQAERSYLRHLSEPNAKKRFFDLCRQQIPCIVVSRGQHLPPSLLEIANNAGISVFQTSMVTMNYINAATVRLDWEFAPTTTLHGCMVDVTGIGILIQGDSGTGKSETVLGLLRRGASLVADDIVRLRNLQDREMIATAPELGRSYMEVRGLGIINVAALFGAGTFRTEKRLDLVITLKKEASLNDVDRVGMDRQTLDILGLQIPHIELPVAAGRDMAQLIEVAALDQKLKALGHDSAVEFNKKLLKRMHDQRKSMF